MLARMLAAAVVMGTTAWVLRAPTPAADAAEGVTITMAPELSWVPEQPSEGRLFVVRLTASIHTAVAGAHGEVGGEELHFERVDERTFESLAAAPVGATGWVEGRARVVYAAGGEEQIPFRVPVAAGTYAHERLTVAPRFGAAPDSADAARLEIDRAKASRVAAEAHRTPRIWTPDRTMPRGSRVTSDFGDGREFNGRISSRHMGLDLQGRRGDTVVATARGVVTLVDEFLLAGNIVYLNHGAGLLSGYFHLSRQLVQVGDTVEAGTPVGLVGATGRVTGPHLHWVVRYGQTSVDPRSLLDVGGR
jgi:murein DD-endopeptidase MepM/ murein hydrolase activator NlpD